VDENGANQGKLILELRVCFVVACICLLYTFQKFKKYYALVFALKRLLRPCFLFGIIWTPIIGICGIRFGARMRAKFGKI
jgi:hypothetical protein